MYVGRQGEAVGIKVNKLSSVKTQLPYEYYSLPFCRPAEIVNSAENLGEARCDPLLPLPPPALSACPCDR
jgi:hypothetical protein